MMTMGAVEAERMGWWNCEQFRKLRGIFLFVFVIFVCYEENFFVLLLLAFWSIQWIFVMSFVRLARPAGWPSLIEKNLKLDITRKLFYEVLSYLPCQAPTGKDEIYDSVVGSL